MALVSVLPDGGGDRADSGGLACVKVRLSPRSLRELRRLIAGFWVWRDGLAARL